MRDYDDIAAFLGTWGPFQRTILLALAISILPNGFVGIYIVFVGDTPPHECLIPEEYNISEIWREAAIPMITQDGSLKRSSCTRYRVDTLRNYSMLGYIPNVDVNMTDIELESCLNGWKYSKDIYQSTIVTEWNLVCENEHKVPLTSSVRYFGALVGTFLSGQISDRFGRRPTLFLMMALQTISIFIQIFSPNWEVFTTLFFFGGFGEISNYLVAYILGSEILGPRERVVFCSMGVFLSSALGYMVMPAVAFFLREWRWLVASMAASGLIYVPLWWFIPESPRWLISQGRFEEAEAILRQAAKRNKVKPPDAIFTPVELNIAATKKEKRYNILDVVRSCDMVAIITLCALLWMIITLGYFSLILNTSNLHGNAYLNCFLSAIVEVPAYVIAMLLLKYCPRRFCQSSTLLLGGAVILFIHLIPLDIPEVAIFLEMVGKFGITAAFCVVYAVTSEVFPTVVRNMAMGICSMSARVASIVSPFILYLGKVYKYLPYILIGSFAVCGGLFCFLLPETFRKALPETFADMQKIRGLRGDTSEMTKDDHAERPEVKEQKF
ncbi:hypothetical protein AOLI_G00202520 [Acnodon oligacanthus]